ncbi:c-type cytochrome [Inmirania thermothiophila]|uniref:c-type cytochrome n=1 Tax=Inmirania thermothiophila TaxID=1750597 RepID=UPI0014756BC3|nr:c-type cytochrome [Inmirania thermothiophila]
MATGEGEVAALREILADPERREQAAAAGRARAALCVRCHGDHGNTARPDIPRLAGQNPYYLLDQLARFASGDRSHYVMTPLARQLGPEERRQVAVFFAVQEGGREAADPALAARGEAVFQARCRACHGDGVAGRAGYPRLAGQHPEYVVRQLERFRSGDRRRHSEVMAQVAASLGEDEIRAVAHYVASAGAGGTPPRKSGDGHGAPAAHPAGAGHGGDGHGHAD